MPSAYAIKDQNILETPVLLFDCTLAGGAVERWSTHALTLDNETYAPRVLAHNAFDMRLGGEDGIESMSRVTVTLANADSYVSQLERNTGLKGARLQVRFLFVNVKTGAAASDPVTLFRGVANPPDEMNEATARLSFMNRLNPQRMLMPNVRIQKRCPWMFPATADDRAEAVSGGDRGKHSPFFRCGYSPDQAGGTGSLDSGGQPFTTCDFTRSSCEQRGMFNLDASNRDTRRFGGVEFVPASVLVRGAGDSGFRVSDPVENDARYNDFVPMVYGTAWYEPPIVFARNDGNLTRMEVLLGLGEIQGVVKVIVNDIEIPLGQGGANMSGTGWYNVVTFGNRTGGFNLNFTSTNGTPLGDPYGSMAYVSVVVPNRVSDGKRLPRVKVLVNGLKVSTFDDEANYTGEAFTNNPAWVLLDLLNRAGWGHDEIELVSFARAAEHCAELIDSADLHGNPLQIARYQTNLVLRRRRSLAEILRGVRNGAGLHLVYGPSGRLELRVESKLAVTNPVKPEGSNAVTTHFGGWPVYEFGDGTNGTTGLLRRENGQPAVRFWSRPTADSPNRFSVEFQDAFNEFQQDSLSLVDAEDARRTGQEIAAQFNALGLPNFDQAARILRLHLDKSLRGNRYVEFESSVRALGVRPGDLITLTYAKEGFDRQLFRVVQVSPRESYATAVITAQLHDENWYLQPASSAFGGRRQSNAGLGLPLPLVPFSFDLDGNPQLGVSEVAEDGTSRLIVEFRPPAKPAASAAGIPLVRLTPEVETTGGTIAGGQSLYYAVSGLDANGAESRLSFLIRATVPQGTNTNRVVLTGLSFSSTTAEFVVYRGPNPQQLVRITAPAAVATAFEDTGLPPLESGPPDQNFHEAKFYWRGEMQPAMAATIVTAFTVGNAAMSVAVDSYKGKSVRIISGPGAGQERVITANSANAVSVEAAWDVLPTAASEFTIAEAGWRYAVASATSPVEFTVPGYAGRTIQIVGHAANVNGQESAPELAVVTRWQLGGSAAGDTGLPPTPFFGVDVRGDGALVVLAVAFPTFDNTRSIASGTLRLYSWNEHLAPSEVGLAAGIDDTETALTFSAELPAAVTAGTFIQVGAEILKVVSVAPDRLSGEFERNQFDSGAVAHGLPALVYPLADEVHVIPFARNFFGSPASGYFAYPIFIPDQRVAAASLFVTNAYGDSPQRSFAFTQVVEQGIRTMSGGQLTMQVDGPLAIGSNLAPAIVVERLQAIRDVRAVVNEAPAGGPIEITVLRNGDPYAELDIFDGEVVSDAVDGFGRAPLQAGDVLTIELTNVPPSSAGTPGRDLTIILRR